VEISVSFTDDVGIKELNTSFRGLNRPTDVLSFPLTEDFDLRTDEKSGFCILGDIVISIERAVEQAELYGHSLEREIGFLTVHSMLHLLGYDHEVGGIKARIMREKEEMILQDLGLSRDNTYLKK
jgi:probable rRNA maturation factor